MSSRSEQAAELERWWAERAQDEIERTVPKAIEYSGEDGGLPQDLVDNGRQIAFVQRREHQFTDAELAEIGIWAYMVGKVNRWSSALRNGRMVSDDTLLDIGVYVRMAQRIRETGGWPGLKQDEGGYTVHPPDESRSVVQVEAKCGEDYDNGRHAGYCDRMPGHPGAHGYGIGTDRFTWED